MTAKPKIRTMFVGGPRHGRWLDGPVGEMFRDVETGDMYKLCPVSMVDQKEGQKYIHKVFVHQNAFIDADGVVQPEPMPDLLRPALMDAVITMWFITGGELIPTGATEMVKVPYGTCTDKTCEDYEMNHEFPSMKDRYTWTVRHNEETGHALRVWEEERAA